MSKKTSRRKFLAESALTVAAATSVNASPATSYNNIVGANNRIRVALLGCAGQGSKDLLNILTDKDTVCGAICDVDDARLARQIKILEENKRDVPTLKPKDYRRVLESKDIEAVVVGTPDHWHALQTIEACQAGKDVYVEKPLGLTVAEGRKMIQAARKYNRIVQTGSMLRSSTMHKEAMEYVQSGKLGKIRMVRAWAYLNWVYSIPVKPDGQPPAGVDYDMWLGPAPKRAFNPNRFHFNFRWYWDYSGGLMTDWGAHMIDLALWGMKAKAPDNAMAGGGKFGFPDDAQETPDTMQAIWNFRDYSLLWEHATFIGHGPEGREHGVAFHGNDAILVVEKGNWEVIPESQASGADQRKAFFRSTGQPKRYTRGEDAHLEHAKNFLACMRSRELPASDVEIGHYTAMACHLGNFAFRMGRSIKWDVENERIIGDEAAQKIISPNYRAPWKLPDVI